MPHLEEGIFHALLDGELDAAEAREAEAHLGGCPECSARLVEARLLASESLALVERLDAPVRATPPGRTGTSGSAPHRRRIPARPLAWAASVLVAAGLGYYGGGYGRARDALPPVTAPTVTAATPAVEPKKEPASRVRAQKATGATGATAEAPVELRQESDLSARGERSFAGAPPSVDEVTAPARSADAAATRPEASAPAKMLARTNRLEEGTVFHPVELSEAVQILGGSIRLIDGLTLDRVDAAGKIVRVGYRLSDGQRVYLEQQRLSRVGNPARELAARARSDGPAAVGGLAPGDTLALAGAEGLPRITWLDSDDFQLVLSADIGTDSLRALARQVR